MYYDKWAIRAFNEAQSGDTICPHCSYRVEGIKVPTINDICPHCEKPLYEPQPDCIEQEYKQTRAPSGAYKWDAGSIIGTVLLSSVFGACGVPLFLAKNYFFGLLLMAIPVFIIGLMIKLIIAQKGAGATHYKGYIVGISYYNGQFTYTPKALEGLKEAQVNRGAYSANQAYVLEGDQLYAMYTIRFNKDGQNIVTRVYEMVTNKRAMGSVVDLNIKKDTIWLSSD